MATMLMFLWTFGDSDRLSVCRAYAEALFHGRGTIADLMLLQEERIRAKWEAWVAEHAPYHRELEVCCLLGLVFETLSSIHTVSAPCNVFFILFRGGSPS